MSNWSWIGSHSIFPGINVRSPPSLGVQSSCKLRYCHMYVYTKGTITLRTDRSKMLIYSGEDQLGDQVSRDTTLIRWLVLCEDKGNGLQRKGSFKIDQLYLYTSCEHTNLYVCALIHWMSNNDIHLIYCIFYLI